MKEKKPVPKFLKIIVIVLAALLVLVIAIAIFAPDPEETPEATTAPVATTEAVPQRAEAVGKSDLSASDYLNGSAPHTMLNDVTGNWRLVTLATPASDFERYALDYYNQFFSKDSENEVHWIVNFTTQTTTSIKCLSGILFVDVFEYIDKEDHDAGKIGGGLPLASYLIYLDNGDIEKPE